jgi:hypothetical protein
MPPNPPGRGSARSAADLNNRIRHLFHTTGGYLRPHERLKYEQLVTAWALADAAERRTTRQAEAVREDMAPAA